MSRELIPFATDDVSSLAKSLRGQLAARQTPPSHVEMLNMLARATGHRNFQHFRTRAAAPTQARPSPADGTTEADQTLVERAVRCFDDKGRLARWPARTGLQHLCMWGVWSKLPAEQVFTEREVSTLLGSLNLFGDHAILRRTLCNLGLMTRTPDGRDYRRVERPPTADGGALIRRLRNSNALRASAPVPNAT